MPPSGDREPATVVRQAGRRQSPKGAGRGARARERRRAAHLEYGIQTGIQTMSDTDVPIPRECRQLIRGGALVAINSSGGKDSQAMTILLSRIVPQDQLVVVHAPLGEVDWTGTIAHIENTIPPGVPLILAHTATGQCLLERIERRGRFPDSGRRYCTSDLKRTPIERELRHFLKAHPRYRGRLVNAMGMRASESPSRSKLAAWRRSERNSRAGREWFDWLPIHALETADVFRVIRKAGQSPHWAYAASMSRLSFSFCILASRADLRRAAELRPGLYRTYVELEQHIGHTLSPTRVPLPALTGVPVQSPDGAFHCAECDRTCPRPTSARLARRATCA